MACAHTLDPLAHACANTHSRLWVHMGIMAAHGESDLWHGRALKCSEPMQCNGMCMDMCRDMRMSMYLRCAHAVVQALVCVWGWFTVNYLQPVSSRWSAGAGMWCTR